MSHPAACPSRSPRSRTAGSKPAMALRLAMLCVLGTTAGAALADPSPALDRFSVSAGAFYADPRIGLNANTNYGRINSPDEEPGHATVPRVKAELLLGDSQGLSFDYYRYDKSYDPSLSGSSVINGIPVSGNASLDGKLRLDLAQLAYKWWIGSGNDVFGIGAGAAYYHARLSGTATATALGVTTSGTDSVSESAYAPLIELGYRHAFTPNLRLVADASGVKKNGGRINGHIYSGTVGVEWFVAKNVGLVADYGISKISLNRDSDNSAQFDVRLKGPSAYLKVRF